MSPAEVKEQLLKQIRHSIGDKSWRVRYMAANHFNEVCATVSGFFSITHLNWQLAEAVGVEIVREELIGQFVQLLKDNEAEVRTAAAGQIPGTLPLFELLRSLFLNTLGRFLKAPRQRSHSGSYRAMRP